jgi:ABC-type transporter Mla subunit MlaD
MAGQNQEEMVSFPEAIQALIDTIAETSGQQTKALADLTQELKTLNTNLTETLEQIRTVLEQLIPKPVERPIPPAPTPR